MAQGEAPEASLVKRKPGTESAAIAGIGYAVLTLVAAWIYRSYPRLSWTEEEIVSWFANSENQRAVIIALNCVAIGAVLFLWFVAVIRRRIGDREDRFFATVFLGSALIYVGLLLVAVSLLSAPAFIAAAGETELITEASGATTSSTAAVILFVVLPRIQAVFVLSTSTIFLRTKQLPKWLAIIGYFAGVAMLIVPIIMEPVGAGFPIWVLVVSLTILIVKATHRQTLTDVRE